MNGVVLVTGACGFVGSHLVDRLLEQGFEVHCLDRLPLDESANLAGVRDHKALRYINGDIRDTRALEELFSAKADVVYHLASVVGVKKYLADPLGLIDVVVGGTRQVVQRAYDSHTKLVFSSTSEIYGRNPTVPWSEGSDRVLGPPSVDRWSYSSSKAVCEHMLHGLASQADFPFSIVRFFNVYGPRQAPYYVISQSIHRALNNVPPLLYDAGTQTRCFTYIDDIIEALLRAGRQSAADGETFNLGNPTETTIRSAIASVLKYCGGSTDVYDFDTTRQLGRRYEDIDRRVPAVEKARDVLGWRAHTDLATGIAQTVEWARQTPSWLNAPAG